MKSKLILLCVLLGATTNIAFSSQCAMGNDGFGKYYFCTAIKGKPYWQDIGSSGTVIKVDKGDCNNNTTASTGGKLDITTVYFNGEKGCCFDRAASDQPWSACNSKIRKKLKKNKF